MAIQEIHLEDVGTEFRSTIRDQNNTIVDISAATLTYLFCKPGGDVLSVSGSLYTDGTDGIAKYVTQSGNLDEIGEWDYQIKVVIGSNQWHTDTSGFYVHPNLA